MSRLSLTVLTDLHKYPAELISEVALIADEDVSGEWARLIVLKDPEKIRKHGIGCFCCSRDEISSILAELFVDHVLGRGNLFREVVIFINEYEEKDLLKVLEKDVLVRARYNIK